MPGEPRDRPSPLPLGAAGRVLGGALAPVYGAAVAWRNARFDRGQGVQTARVPVVSVGNLSVGGTGKTPMVAWVVEALRAAGRTPAVALRGYKGGADGAGSDEAAEYRERLTGIELAIGGDRVATVSALLSRAPKVDCVVMDDGFQHRRLARALDVVLVDATRDVFADRLLPAGWLREPVESLARAGVIVITHVEAVEERVVRRMREQCAALAPRALIATAKHQTELAPLGEDRPPVVVFCGIGNPGPFVDAVRTRADVRGVALFEDHARYDPARMGQIDELARREGARMIVTTGKDWPKVRGIARATEACPIVVLGLRLSIEPAEAVRKAVLAVVDGNATARASLSASQGL